MEQERTHWNFEPGEEIAPGRVALNLLGRGSRYEVWQALDDRLLAVVVVKILRPDKLYDHVARQELANEVSVLDSLAHPMIVRLLDAQVDGERPHIVLEHLEGPTLRSLIRKYGPLPMEQLLPLTLHVCSALHYLAYSRTCHLDIKPANIIMSAPPRLIDLSIARTFEAAARLQSRIGTYTYMAPEQCEPGARGVPGPWSDIWGLGVTLYEACVGSTPWGWDGNDPPDAFPQTDNEPAYPPEGIPQVLVDTVLACLEPEPLKRPAAAEVAMALEPLVAGLPRNPILRRRRPG